jgi:flagellar biosynthesis/type III secretory pathway protein FliH
MKVRELNPKIKMTFSDQISISDGDYEQGYKDGYADGYKKGESEGYTNGLNDGYADGYNEGYLDGSNSSYWYGYESGKIDGYSEGYTKGMQDGNIEGYDRGYSIGYEQGYSEGYNKGKEDGKAEGYTEGETAGYNRGFTEGETKGIEQGKKAQYDEFWDACQDYGNRTAYSGAFQSSTWNIVTFKPKYDIRPVGSATSMFSACWVSTDLVEFLENQGVILDFSECTSLQMTFQGCHFSRIGVIDARKSTSLSQAFAYTSYLKRIDKLIVGENQVFQASTFAGTSLNHLIIEGVIASNNLNVSNSVNLDYDSLMSIINCLKDFSTDTSGTSHTVTLGTTNLAKLTDAEKAIATQKGWTLA